MRCVRGVVLDIRSNLDIARDARWGRMGETFGEDALLTSEMGKYAIWGFQGRDGKYSVESRWLAPSI